MSAFTGTMFRVGKIAALVAFTTLLASPALSAAAADDATRVRQLEASVAKLAREKADLSAKLAAKQREVDALGQLLKDNGIEAPATSPGSTTATTTASGGRAVATATAGGGIATATASSAGVMKGPWVVRVIANEDVDLAALQAKLDIEQKKLDDVEKRVGESKSRSDRMDSARTSDSYRNRFGDYEYKKAFTEKQRDDARAEVRMAEGERRRVLANVKRIEREIADADKTRLVTGQLEDGTAVELRADTTAAVALARAMVPGASYRVTGTGVKSGQIVKVRLVGAVKEG